MKILFMLRFYHGRFIFEVVVRHTVNFLAAVLNVPFNDNDTFASFKVQVCVEAFISRTAQCVLLSMRYRQTPS